MEGGLGAFIHSFNAEAHQQLRDEYPHFARDELGNRSEPNRTNARGAFWTVTKDHWESVAPLQTTDWNELCTVWEEIVRILQGREKFTGEPYFFHFRGFWSLAEERPETLDRNKLVPRVTGVYPLTAGKAYELSLFHYMPGDAPTDPRSRLVISASNPIIAFTSSSQFPVDSGYDEKKARFVVGDSAGGGRGIFSISGSHRKMIGDEEKEVTVSWFDLPFEVPSNYLWNGFKGAVVATPLAIGTTIAIATNDKITRPTQLWLVPLAFLGTWLSGMAGAIWVKK